MKFHTEAGIACTFAMDHEEAVELLGTKDIKKVSLWFLTSEDWNIACESYGIANLDAVVTEQRWGCYIIRD